MPTITTRKMNPMICFAIREPRGDFCQVWAAILLSFSILRGSWAPSGSETLWAPEKIRGAVPGLTGVKLVAQVAEMGLTNPHEDFVLEHVARHYIKTVWLLGSF